MQLILLYFLFLKFILFFLPIYFHIFIPILLVLSKTIDLHFEKHKRSKKLSMKGLSTLIVFMC